MGLNSSSGGKPPATAHPKDSGCSGEHPGHEGALGELETPSPDAPGADLPDVANTRVQKQRLQPPDKSRYPGAASDGATVRSTGDGGSAEPAEVTGGQFRAGLRLLLESLVSLVWNIRGTFRGQWMLCVGQIVLSPRIRKVKLVSSIALLLMSMGAFLCLFMILGETHLKPVANWVQRFFNTPLGETSILLSSLLSGYFTNRLLNSLFDSIRDLRKNTKELILLKTKWLVVWSRWCENRRIQCRASIGDIGHALRVLCNIDEPLPRQPKESQDTEKELEYTPNQNGGLEQNVREFNDIVRQVRCVIIVIFVLFLSVLIYQSRGNGVPIKPEMPSPSTDPVADNPPLAKPIAPVEPSVYAEPIAALPVLFHTALVEEIGGSKCDVSIDSSGVELVEHSKNQLKSFVSLVKSVLDSDPDLMLLVVGYASDTNVSCGLTGEYYNELNVKIANLRAQAVGDFLNEELNDIDRQRIQCRRWQKLRVLLDCRPYKSLVRGKPVRKDDNFAPLERMNQSVMLYVIDAKDTNEKCIGGKDSATPCSEL